MRVHTRVYVLMYVEVVRGVNEDECVCLGIALQPLSTEQLDGDRYIQTVLHLSPLALSSTA